tara:strand:- start:37 stop:804 length:768 start_codon:yes stop_codon:yes gene_type:complete
MLVRNILRKIIKIKNNYFRKIFFNYNTLKIFNYKYTVYFSKKDNNELSDLCKKYMTNKGYNLSQLKDEDFNLGYYQNYDDYYSEIFSLNKKRIQNVFELGIGTINDKNHYNMNFLGKNYLPGASLRVWKDYFPNADIFGADIDKEILFSEERIKTCWVDQINKDSIIKMYNYFGVDKFDIIIDDGCHRYNETINFFENSINKLSNDGIYIIEDILLSQQKKFINYFKKTEYKAKIVKFHRPGNYLGSNSIITIRK